MNAQTRAAVDETRLASLMQRVAARDQVAFILLHDALAPLVRRLVRRIVDDPRDADETCNDVFKAIWAHAGGYDAARGDVASWVGTIARNRARDARRRCRSQRIERADAVAIQLDQLAGEAAADADATAQEQGTAVRRALAFLTTRRRTIVRMAFLEERSHSEIAAVTARPLGTIKATIRRTLLLLRERLSGSNAGRPD